MKYSIGLLSCLVAVLGCGGGDNGTQMNPLMGGAGGIGGAGAAAGGVPPAGGGGAGGASLPTAGDGMVSPMAGNGGGGGAAGMMAGTGGSAGTGVEIVPERHSWMSFGGDLEHTRYSASETILSVANASELKPAVDIKAPGVTATPALHKGVIYWTDWGGFVHATNLESGEEEWKVDKSANVGGYTGSPAVTDAYVYVANRNGLVSQIDRLTGMVGWEAMLDAGVHTHIWSSPVVVEQDNVLIVGVGGLGTRDNGIPLPRSRLETFRGSVVGIDLVSGQQIWTFATTAAPNGAGVSVWSSAAVDTTRKLAFIGTGNNYYTPVSDYSDSLVAINYMTGDYVWHVQFTPNDAWTVGTPFSGVDGDVGATPNLFEINGRAVVGVGDKPGRYHVHDRETGALVWSKSLTNGSGFQGGVMAPAAYHDGVIYVVSNNGTSSSTAFALDAAAMGEILWEFDLVDPTFGGPALGNGVLYVGDQAGNIYALNADTGAKLFDGDVPAGRGGGFSLVDGMLFTGYGFHFSESNKEPLMPGGLMAFSRSGKVDPIGPMKTDDCVPGTALTADPTFNNVYQGVLCPAGCTKVCHTSSREGSLQIDFRDIAYANLVGVTAKGAACMTSGKMLVQANDPAQSVLHSKLALTPLCGLAMPPGATAATTSVTPAMLDVVRAWIMAGAPNN
jgi:polyvinyl alcohol dehydrogenase (cytochrome)